MLYKKITIFVTMKGLLEFKNLNGEVKDVDVKNRIVTGYLSAFGNKDFDSDIMEKGAFSKSINERKDKIVFLNNHNMSQPHGKFDILKEDNKGLYFESTPFIKGVSYSEDVLKLYEAGIIKEHSVGFVTIKSDIDHREKARVIKEVKLYEGSNVTMGANPETQFAGFKSLTLAACDEHVSRIMKMLKVGTLTDDTFILLEFALKQLQSQAYELGKTALIEPSIDTPKEPHLIINEFINSLN